MFFMLNITNVNTDDVLLLKRTISNLEDDKMKLQLDIDMLHEKLIILEDLFFITRNDIYKSIDKHTVEEKEYIERALGIILSSLQ